MKKEENVYSPEQEAGLAAEAEKTKEKGPTALGKFRDVNALAEAYGALEAEFTRRSQRLRELEKRAENFGKESFAGSAEAEKSRSDAERTENAGAEALKDNPAPKPAEAKAPPVGYEGKASEETQVKAETEDMGEDALYRAASRSEAVRLKIVGDYLASLRSAEAPLMKGGTGTLAVPPVKARSISEAGNMALHYFKKDSQA